jgi:aminoglycoside phosphotransferase (APT) family kinase protein
MPFDLPPDVVVQEFKQVPEGETNNVYLCQGFVRGEHKEFFLKINKNPKISLINEEKVINALKKYGIPVPSILFASHNGNEFIAVEKIHGVLLWDLIDPSRDKSDSQNVKACLFEYGKWLAKIHQLPLKWDKQKRTKLYDLIGEEDEVDERYKTLSHWIRVNNPQHREEVFVHGDYNTASVILESNQVRGIIDWEFAGSGWKEYDLAWALRARKNFLNTAEERLCILEGYNSVGQYDEFSLKWCEVLNYLHFAFWVKDSDQSYNDFALKRGLELIGIVDCP